eukprot:TRINITY_DN5149_c0_g1_i1.p1 TRINITY_DN5149_c0_g1~~TRINITY_DN5149_c0_g1_i1.p1  ORF type:complete len:265 (+),score=81.00 TRINITY_DN5149_c0_g1_i1:99-797(+)
MTSVEDVVVKAEAFHADAKFAEAFDLLSSSVKDHPDAVEIQWRLARAFYDNADQKPSDKAYQYKQLQEALAVAETVLKLDDNHFAGHKWLAIILAAIGDHVSTKEKIGNSLKIKEHALKALELSGDDATTLHLLGRWCIGVSNVGWLERKVANAIFGSVPESTYDEALEYLLKADKINERMIRNKICIGDCYVGLKKKPEAKEWYQKASVVESRTPLDTVLIAEAKKKFKSV